MSVNDKLTWNGSVLTVPFHHLQNIGEIVSEMYVQISEAIEFASAHPKVFGKCSDKIDEMKIKCSLAKQAYTDIMYMVDMCKSRNTVINVVDEFIDFNVEEFKKDE